MQFNCSPDVFTSNRWDHKSDLHLQLAVKSYSYSQLGPSKDRVYKMNNCVCFSSHTQRAAELCAAVAHCACAVALHVISIHFCRLITDLNINVNACYSQILIAINPSEFRASLKLGKLQRMP